MNKLYLLSLLFFIACSPNSTPPVTLQNPQNFSDLLEITDKTDLPICSLSLSDLRANLTADEIETAKTTAFDMELIGEKYADDFVDQIRVQFRRAALKRRMNVSGDPTELAQKYYGMLKPSITQPTSLEEFHTEYHYWMDRISEQNEYGAPDSAEYNLRFCVMNEKRADLHAASRKDLLARLKDGIKLPAPEFIENVNHEMPFDKTFSDEVLAEIFTSAAIETLSPLERAQIRGDQAFLSSDPKVADLFWEKRDEEISAMIYFIQAHKFSNPAKKLEYMRDIDQSLRKLWYQTEAKAHFDNEEQFEIFKVEISKRVTEVDAFNTAEIQKMLKGRGWFRDDRDGSGAAHNAWLIAQHADRNPEFQEAALKLIEAELDAPGVSRSNYAYLYDRVQMRFSDRENAKPFQRYATQGRCTGPGTWEPLPYENPEKIDETRASVGLGTLAEYKARFKNSCTEDQR